MPNVREPKIVSSIEKKNKIIKAGLEVFGSKGYHNTTTVDIAKKAGVSTGIVYNYFVDKKDIFLHSLKLYFDKTYQPIIDKINSLNYSSYENTIDELIEFSIVSHKEDLFTHEEMVAMSHLDTDVHKVFIYAENKITEQILLFLQKNNISFSNMKEKIHIAYNLVDNLCHELFYHRHDYIDYEQMKNETKKTILLLVKN
ncbi:MAG: TetR/AcrR family transcriptional regulator [Clostridia bacterium]|nr:TetR/AcrR family transcriptional regulator [Clostridia bacterium]